MIWLPAALLAGLFQAWRTAVQQRLRIDMSVNAAGLVRYFYGLPVACAMLAAYLSITGQAGLDTSAEFWCFAAAAGFAQIVGTSLLIMAFGYHNYVVGTAYAKTEAVQGALLAVILLREILSALTWLGISISVAGVLIISARGERLRWRQATQPAALCGLGAGFCFAMTSILVKSATQVLATDDLVLAALTVLVTVIGLQVLMLGSYILMREASSIVVVLRSWRISGQVGVLAAFGSACWFTGFAIAPVALVRAVGQVEILFTFAFGHYYLKEAVTRHEVGGVVTVAVGVLLAFLGAI